MPAKQTLTAVEVADVPYDLRVLRAALTASVRMQTHYARILNKYDGGDRPLFDDAPQFIQWLESKVRDVCDGCPPR